MKIGQVISRIKSEYSKGASTDDTRLSDRLIYNKLLTIRGLLFHQKLKANRKIANWELQPIEKIKFKRFSFSVMRSIIELPKAITYENKNIKIFKGEYSISLISIEQSKYINANKYTSDTLWAYLYDNHLFINDMSIKDATVYGLWRDPIEAFKLNNPTVCTSNKDIDFYTPDDIIDVAIKQAANELLVLFSKEKEDITNNSVDSPLQETK